jgi:hypothetical protein
VPQTDRPTRWSRPKRPFTSGTAERASASGTSFDAEGDEAIPHDEIAPQ